MQKSVWNCHFLVLSPGKVGCNGRVQMCPSEPEEYSCQTRWVFWGFQSSFISWGQKCSPIVGSPELMRLGCSRMSNTMAKIYESVQTLWNGRKRIHNLTEMHLQILCCLRLPRAPDHLNSHLSVFRSQDVPVSDRKSVMNILVVRKRDTRFVSVPSKLIPSSNWCFISLG